MPRRLRTDPRAAPPRPPRRPIAARDTTRRLAFLKQPGAEPPPPRRVTCGRTGPDLPRRARPRRRRRCAPGAAGAARPARPAAGAPPSCRADAIPPALATVARGRRPPPAPPPAAETSAAPTEAAARRLPDPASLSRARFRGGPARDPAPADHRGRAADAPRHRDASAPSRRPPPPRRSRRGSSSTTRPPPPRSPPRPATALEAAGAARVETIPVRFAIGRSNIRYYHDGDRQSATALAAARRPRAGRRSARGPRLHRLRHPRRARARSSSGSPATRRTPPPAARPARTAPRHPAPHRVELPDARRHRPAGDPGGGRRAHPHRAPAPAGPLTATPDLSPA